MTTNPATSSVGQGPRAPGARPARAGRGRSPAAPPLAWRRGRPDPLPRAPGRRRSCRSSTGGPGAPDPRRGRPTSAARRSRASSASPSPPTGSGCTSTSPASDGREPARGVPGRDRERDADPGRPRQRARTVLAIPHPEPTHNGGQLAFGPDGMLYLAVGDGGGHRGEGPGQVPGGNSQSLDTLLGKILRIDPTPSGDRPYTVPADNPYAAGGGHPEIWHHGLRNPWRFSFDRRPATSGSATSARTTGRRSTSSPATPSGLNFGYPLLEGTHPLQAAEAPGTVAPRLRAVAPSGNCAVTGGVVYRGRALPELRGHYVFADYCQGDLKALGMEDGAVASLAKLRLGAPADQLVRRGPGRGALRGLAGRRGCCASPPRNAKVRRCAHLATARTVGSRPRSSPGWSSSLVAMAALPAGGRASVPGIRATATGGSPSVTSRSPPARRSTVRSSAVDGRATVAGTVDGDAFVVRGDLVVTARRRDRRRRARGPRRRPDLGTGRRRRDRARRPGRGAGRRRGRR